MKPVIIYLSGAPGSGKTTLAQHISNQLNIHHISSDLIHGSVALTMPEHDRNETLLNVFVPYLIHTADMGISFVVDHVLQKDLARETIIDKLTEHATVIYIHTQAKDPIARYVHRIENDGSAANQSRRDALLARAEYHSDNLEDTMTKIDLNIPTLVVDTDDGYEPILEDIINFIKSKINIH